MKPLKIHTFLLAACLFLVSCIPKSKKINWSITLDKKDKKPYGCFIAHQSAKLLFPTAKVIDLSPGFRYTSIDKRMTYPSNGRSMLIAAGLDFYLSQAELSKLITYASSGNEVMIFSRTIDHKLETYLRCSIQDNGIEELPLSATNPGNKNANVLTLINTTAQFGYEGRSVLAYIAPVTNAVAAIENLEPAVLSDTLGFVRQQPNFLRYNVGSGHIILHSAPLVLSNYFLLQPNNKKYLEGVFSFTPSDISVIYWNDYYKRNTRASDLSILLRYPATRWALFLSLFALLVYVLFEGKRRQRIIPEIKPLENSSASFVETIARLYYHEGNHTNLAEKMIQHFLEWVRTHYFISTNQLDDRFAAQLVTKSGVPENTIRSMMELIREIHTERKPIDETDLYHLHNTIQQFYNNYKK